MTRTPPQPPPEVDRTHRQGAYPGSASLPRDHTVVRRRGDAGRGRSCHRDSRYRNPRAFALLVAGHTWRRVRRRSEAHEGSRGSDLGLAGRGREEPGPSEVIVFVAVEARGSDDHPFEVVPRKNDPQRPQIRACNDSSSHPYAAFPLQPKESEARIGMETKTVRVGVTFKLTLTYPKVYEDDLQAALWAWETFGGIGARTRRGFGALQCTQREGQAVTAPSAMQVKGAIQAGLQRHVVNGVWPPNVPQLSRSLNRFEIVEFESGTTPLVAWEQLDRGPKAIPAKASAGQRSQAPRTQLLAGARSHS